MFDKNLNEIIKRPLVEGARLLLECGLKANQVTWVGFAIGLCSVPLIYFGHFHLAILTIALNRIADGLDGAMARLSRPTDTGAFLDISLDFLFYSSIPLAFALHNPNLNGIASVVLIYGFIGTGSTFLAYAVLAAKRNLNSTNYPNKGIFYLGGLTESTETILVFVMMCLVPDFYAQFAYFFAALCGLTTITRVVGGIMSLSKFDSTLATSPIDTI